MSEFTGCTRSHPHENMTEECQFKTETARTINKLANELAASNKLLAESLDTNQKLRKRELELLAVIDDARIALRNHGMYEVADLLFGEPSQALREHEAKMLEEASKEFIGDEYRETTYGMVERMLCRMAEERRKK